MDLEPLARPEQEITEEEWQRTPASVKRLIQDLERRVSALEQENQRLRERLASNSANSSLPPSSDRPEMPPCLPKKPSGKKRGGQPGHAGHTRKLIPVEQCQKVVNHYPQRCRHCGQRLAGQDPQPHRHQVVDLPPVVPQVEEHRLHQLGCPQCGTATRAQLPREVPASGYGPGVVATVAVLGGFYRASQRMTQAALSDLFGVELALGTVEALRQQASEAVAAPVAAACQYVQQQPVVHSDETGFAQGNGDGRNPTQCQAWLWVAVTTWVTVFRVSLSRSQRAAQELLGKAFAGILVSDRWSGYHWVRLRRRQLCWAHLKREFQKIAERGGDSGRLGEALLEQARLLFACWHRVREGTLSRGSFQRAAGTIRRLVKSLLEEGAAYRPQPREQSARDRTARTCRQLLKLEPALWLFVRVEGVEPTNNAAERAIRPAVLWRRTSFGTQSAAGSEFVARMLTVVLTLRSQQRSVLDYLRQACRAAREGVSAPSLLPKSFDNANHMLPACYLPLDTL
jgi:transposase